MDVPSIGPSAWLLSCYGTVQYISKGQELLRDAVQKVKSHSLRHCHFGTLSEWLNLQHKGNTIKVPEPDKWNIVVNRPELIDEIQKATEDKLSFNGALDDVSYDPILLSHMKKKLSISTRYY